MLSPLKLKALRSPDIPNSVEVAAAPSEVHESSLEEIVAATEAERQRRIEEDSKIPDEVHDSDRAAVAAQAEAERERRAQEQIPDEKKQLLNALTEQVKGIITRVEYCSSYRCLRGPKDCPERGPRI